MPVELLQTLSVVSFIGAAVLFLVAVALFFLFDIPKIFGEVTGATAKKAIEDIRKQNERTGNKAYKPSPVNAERGRLTDKISPSGKLLKNEKKSGISVGTERLNTAELPNDNNSTTVLNYSSNETTVLQNLVESNETTILNKANHNIEKGVNIKQNFNIDIDISFSESNEIIE